MPTANSSDLNSVALEDLPRGIITNHILPELDSLSLAMTMQLNKFFFRTIQQFFKKVNSRFLLENDKLMAAGRLV